MTDPQVSVIVTVYNHGQVLPYALDSVLAQTLKNFEVIIVDDHSTDISPSIIDYYCRYDGRIRTVRNEVNSRRGPIEWEPRNDGLKLVNAPLVAYLDADNCWDSEFLEELATALLSNDRWQLVHCDSRNFYAPEEVESVVRADARSITERGTNWTIFAHQDLDATKLGSEQYVDTNEMMHRATIFRRLGHLWRTTHPRREWINRQQGKRCPYRRHNDLDLVERVIECFGIDSIGRVPRPLVNFFYPTVSRPAHSVATMLRSEESFRE